MYQKMNLKSTKNSLKMFHQDKEKSSDIFSTNLLDEEAHSSTPSNSFEDIESEIYDLGNQNYEKALAFHGKYTLEQILKGPFSLMPNDEEEDDNFNVVASQKNIKDIVAQTTMERQRSQVEQDSGERRKSTKSSAWKNCLPFFTSCLQLFYDQNGAQYELSDEDRQMILQIKEYPTIANYDKLFKKDVFRQKATKIIDYGIKNKKYKFETIIYKDFKRPEERFSQWFNKKINLITNVRR